MKVINYFKENYILISTLFVAAFLRLYHLNYQSIWVDEIHTMIESSPNISFKDSNEIILFREGTPRLYFYLVRFFNTIFGHNVFNTRLVSVIFGVLSVFYINKLGEKLFNKNVGILSSIFLAVNLFLIEYSQEGRTYSMLVFFVIISFCFLITFTKKRTYKNAIFLGIFSGFITNAHPIGILNVVSIFLILLYYLINIKGKEAKIDLFKKIFLSGIISVILFLPTIPTLLTVSSYQSFWIIKPNLPYLFQIFNQLLGSSLIFTIIFVFIYIIFIIKSLKIISDKENLYKNNFLNGFIILNTWIWFEVAIILLKSYFGISIVLHRYFISIVPAFTIIIAVTIDFISKTLLKRFITIILVIYLLFDIFIIQNYYCIKRKSQFDKVANFIIKENTSKTKIISSMGWLMGYYFNEKNQLTTQEKTLNNCIDDMRKGVSSPSSFWYIDGNSNFFNLSNENKEYVNANFVVRNNYKAFDAWCVEFKSKHNESAFIELKRFQPSMFDGSGAMIFIENKTSKYPTINLEKGDYKLLIKGFSLPNIPINEENAHFNIVVNKAIIKSIYLNNIPDEKPKEINFHHDGGDFNLELIYDNDIAVGKLDRNAVINNISLVKK